MSLVKDLKNAPLSKYMYCVKRTSSKNAMVNSRTSEVTQLRSSQKFNFFFIDGPTREDLPLNI